MVNGTEIIFIIIFLVTCGHFIMVGDEDTNALDPLVRIRYSYVNRAALSIIVLSITVESLLDI